jgi:DNA-directed RNA polymerase specialized sigma24 family protein
MNISELWAENAEFVLKICERFVRNPAMAKDIRQEVFFKILSSTETFKDQAAVKTWLYSITYHCCVDYFRTRRKQKQIEDEWLLQGGLFLRDSQAPVWTVGKASEMPCPISQLFVELVFGEGWTTDEISAVFGFSKRYVNKKIQEGLDQLQNSI